MKSKSWDAKQAVEHIRQTREGIHPNSGFLSQLNEYEQELGIAAKKAARATRVTQMRAPSSQELVAPDTRRIMVCVDGTPVSDYVLDWALRKLFRPTDFVSLALFIKDQSDRQRKEHILHGYSSILETRNVRHSQSLFQGDPKEEIARVADAEKSDMIVVGSRNLGRAKGLIMGSVSAAVTHTASCPVMVIKLPKE